MDRIIFLFILVEITSGGISLPFNLTTKEALLGSTVILNCQSNDKNYNFLIWQPADSLNGLVGPSNNFSTLKYNYEILSGKLIIKEVSFEDNGIYHCISRGVLDEKINISAIKLVVIDGATRYNSVGYYIYHVIFFIGIMILIAQIIFIIYYKMACSKSENDRLDYLECMNDEEDLMTTVDLSVTQKETIIETENQLLEKNEMP